MHTILLTTDTAANAKIIADLLSKMKTVKSVSVDPVGIEKYNWTNPSRPATDEEFEQLAVEMEQDKGNYSAKDVLSFVNEEIKQWRKKKK